MPVDLKILCRQIKPDETVLLFGAGSSIPSGAPSSADLAEQLAHNFDIAYTPDLLLSEISTIVEKKRSRVELISFLRSRISGLKPTGSLINLPLFSWLSVYTTNYDNLIENVYKHNNSSYKVLRSNFDFAMREDPVDISIYKLHGSIEEDVSDGKNSRIIITVGDYDKSYEYRELLFDKFKLQISSANVLVIGHSLSDPDLRAVIDEALRRKRDAGAKGRIFVLSYMPDNNRAMILEDRGITVCFGDLDELFVELSKSLPSAQLVLSISDDPMDGIPSLRPLTIDVAHAVNNMPADVTKMYNGRSATYGDIAQRFTFSREIASQIEAQFARENECLAYILGAAGVGKSTAARQVLLHLTAR